MLLTYPLTAMSRIAIIGCRGYPSYYSGFETLVRHLSPYLAAQGHEVTVYGRDGRIWPHSEHMDGIEVRYTPGIDRKSTSTLSFGLSATLDARRRRYDAALVLNVANGPYLRILQHAGVPTCVNVDGMEWMRGKWGVIAKSMFKYGAVQTARYADKLIMDSTVIDQLWLDNFGRDGTFIPYGAPVLDNVGHDRLIEQNLNPAEYVLVVARIVPENNIDLLLDALVETAVPIVIVGDAGYRHATTDRLEMLKGSGRIHWLGHVSDQLLLDQLWSNAGVYWHGHSVGGTNPSLLQALGAGAPTVALATPFNREVLVRDEHLIPDDPGILRETILDILGNPAVQDRMRAWGKYTVNSRYTWIGVCRAYEELLMSLVRP
jgi:glycosyltransferase involved in cell wall biosynthesis